MTPDRIRAYHPESGSVMQAEVVRRHGQEPRRSFELIPDGLLELVVIREGVWIVTELTS